MFYLWGKSQVRVNFETGLLLVIEIDGGYHHKQIGYDKGREELLYKIGIKTVRFENDNVIKNIDKVFEELDEIIKEREKELK